MTGAGPDCREIKIIAGTSKGRLIGGYGCLWNVGQVDAIDGERPALQPDALRPLRVLGAVTALKLRCEAHVLRLQHRAAGMFGSCGGVAESVDAIAVLQLSQHLQDSGI